MRKGVIISILALSLSVSACVSCPNCHLYPGTGITFNPCGDGTPKRDAHFPDCTCTEQYGHTHCRKISYRHSFLHAFEFRC